MPLEPLKIVTMPEDKPSAPLLTDTLDVCAEVVGVAEEPVPTTGIVRYSTGTVSV